MRRLTTTQNGAGWVVLLLLALLLSACRTSAPVVSPPHIEVAYRIVYVVHGDASYLYHDSTGTARQADAQAVAQAQTVARGLPEAEVFVFHQRPQRRLLGLLPRSDGTLYHYRGGQLVQQQRYDRTAQPLQAEARLLTASAAPDTLPSVFLYFGHAIPEQEGTGYHRSHPDWTLTTDRLAQGLGRLDHAPFALIVLSTCTNGTPGTLAALAPQARYVVASPEDVHLSHLDSRALLQLEGTTFDAGRLAERLAVASFEALTERTQTTVTLGVYDTATLAPVLTEVAPKYRQRLARIAGPPAYRDCAADSTFKALLQAEGVTVWHRPARFGRNRGVAEHSGWGCPAPR